MARRFHPIVPWALPLPRALRGQAATVARQIDHEVARQLGAIPRVLPILDRLGLRDTVNDRCHPDGTTGAYLDTGRVVEVLVLHRLLAPQPLVHVEDWTAQSARPALLYLDADQCNDDRLARRRDALVPHLDARWQDLIVTAIPAFDLDLRRLCDDITSVSCADWRRPSPTWRARWGSGPI